MANAVSLQPEALLCEYFLDRGAYKSIPQGRSPPPVACRTDTAGGGYPQNRHETKVKKLARRLTIDRQQSLLHQSRQKIGLVLLRQNQRDEFFDQILPDLSRTGLRIRFGNHLIE